MNLDSDGPGRHGGALMPGGELALSVVIPCRNGAEDLPAQLRSLAEDAIDEPWEVVVADNGSTDDSRAVALQFADRLPVRIVDASARPGRSYACNVGAREARSEAIAFLDVDDEVAPGYLKAMRKALRDHDFVAAYLDCETLNPSWVLKVAAPYQTDALLDAFYDFLPYALGCSLGITRQAFDRVGGYHEDVPWTEDVDFCWRVQQIGIPLVLAGEACVRRRYRDTLEGFYRQSRGAGIGQVALYRKHRALGMPGRRWKSVLTEWAWLAREPLLLRSRADVARWLNQLGYNVGRFRGSLQSRVSYF